MFAQGLNRENRRTLVHLRQALEVVLSHDGHARISDLVGLLHIATSDDPLTVRKLGTELLGRQGTAGLRVFKRLQVEYFQNGKIHYGLGFIQPVAGAGPGQFKLTARGETVLRSIVALLGTQEERHDDT